MTVSKYSLEIYAYKKIPIYELSGISTVGGGGGGRGVKKRVL
jgi:hypothetical protein